MSYAVPHYRYGAMLYSDQLVPVEQNRKMNKEMDRKFKQTFKDAINISKKTPNKVIESLLKSWNMETLSDLSYTMALHKWIRHK